eukprot:7161262-Prymnesium_polylepis.2
MDDVTISAMITLSKVGEEAMARQRRRKGDFGPKQLSATSSDWRCAAMSSLAKAAATLSSLLVLRRFIGDGCSATERRNSSSLPSATAFSASAAFARASSLNETCSSSSDIWTAKSCSSTATKRFISR